MSFTNKDYRETVIRSLHDRANHYRERWSGTVLSRTPWWACSTLEQHQTDDDVPKGVQSEYHFDQDFIVAFMKLYSIAAPTNKDPSAFDQFCEMYDQSRTLDMETIKSDEDMQKALYSFMAGLDMIFFSGVFTSPVETPRGHKQQSGQELVDEDWKELESPWVPGAVPLVSLETLLAPLPSSDAGHFEPSSNTIRIWCQNRDGVSFNLDYLFVVLAHEMMHAYLHIFGYDSGVKFRAHHGGEFWAGLEFIYYSIWQAIPWRIDNVLVVAAATARQNRQKCIGDSDLARYGLGPAFFKGLSCPMPHGLTPAMVDKWNTDKLGL
ncbi:hypothetical protein G7054_g9963 [Neopestalotiopsis clavispora]|nr:hypothetical protein G7054_g9963 [Neopestalotiopsis clavispora]